MKSKSCNFYHTNTKNPGDNPGIFFDPYNTADFEWLQKKSTPHRQKNARGECPLMSRSSRHVRHRRSHRTEMDGKEDYIEYF